MRRVGSEKPRSRSRLFCRGIRDDRAGHGLWRSTQAKQSGITNFSLLVAHVLVPPAMEAILSSAQNRIQGFLAAGHVCTVMGYEEYETLAQRYRGSRSL